ncbi:MAG: pentapeptide repeat-containing protein [Gammaproteobacteria bacterium]|nr:pentapeptide repeat-containing protein [Gammaproteobacteria bacterium]
MKSGNIKRVMTVVCLLLWAASNPVVAGCFDKREAGMDWSGCQKTNKMLDESNFSGSRFDDANLALSSLDDSNFKGASLVKTDLTRATARRSRFEGADLTKSVGYRAVFDEAILEKTNLAKSEYFRASFRDARITDTDWSRSELGRVDFSAAQLNGVSFQYSNLSRVIFSETKLENVDFEGAYTYLTHVEKVDLRAVKNLSQLQLNLSCGDLQTRLPKGLWIPDTWPCEE